MSQGSVGSGDVPASRRIRSKDCADSRSTERGFLKTNPASTTAWDRFRCMARVARLSATRTTMRPSSSSPSLLRSEMPDTVKKPLPNTWSISDASSAETRTIGSTDRPSALASSA